MIFISNAGTIADLQERDDLILLTNITDVDRVLWDLGYPSHLDTNTKVFSGLLVSIFDGDYDEVFAFEGSVPYLWKPVWKLTKS